MGKSKLLSILLAVSLVILLSGISYAQETRVLMTTDQQYQNSAANADFESWINWTIASTNPPDGWAKVSTPTIAKETATAKIGAASLKITGDAGQGISQVVSIEKNTTYVVSFYYKVNTGHTCTFSLTGDSTGAFTLTGASGLDSTTWARKAFTITTGADTALTVKMLSDAAANVFYFDGVSVTKGTATPAFARAALTDSGAQTLNGDLTVNGATNLNGDVNLGDLSTDNITLTGTLKSPSATDVSVQSTTGILKLDKASVNNELRVFENSATPTAYSSLRHQNLTTSAGNITINPAGGTTNVTGALAVSTTVTATGNLSAAMLSSDGANFYDFGNANGNVPVSNGTVNTNLNADKLDGLDASTSGANAHALATDSSGNISVVNATLSGALVTGSNPASAGQIRLPNNTWISARNASNSGNVNLISADTSDRVAFGANVAAFTVAGTITGSGSPTIASFGTINGATLSGGTLSGGAYSGTALTPTALTAGDGVSYTIQPTINVATPGTTGYTALKVGVTETSVGSGTKNLLDLSVGASQKFVVDSTGQLTTGIIPGSKVSGDITGNAANVTGIVTTVHGGTGADLSSGAQGGVTYKGATAMAVSAAGNSGQVLVSGGTGAPTWTTDIAGNAANVTGTVAPDHGGTGITSYAIGDLVYASGATTLAKLADVATGSVLVSGGAGAAPSYSSSPTISGALTVQGSGDSSFSNGRLGIGASPTAPLDVAKSYTTASATDYGAIVRPTFNVATGGANNYTAFLVKSTETNLAGYTGAKLLLDLQAGSTPASKFSVDNSGNVISGTINSQTIGATSTFGAVNADSIAVGGGYGSSGATMDSAGNLKLDGNIYIKGVMYRENLTDLQVQNSTITLNASDAPSDADAYIGVMSGGTKTSPTYTGQIKWTAAAATWDISNDLSLATGKAYKINNTSVLSATTLGSGVVNSSLQSVGTISTGTWSGTAIAVNKGGTNLTSYTTGDLVYASGATTLAKLADVATGSVLVSGGAGTAPSYSNSPTLGGTLTVQGAGDSSFAGEVGIGTASPTALLDVYNKPANASGLAVAALVKPDYSLLNTAGDGYTALKVNITDAQAGATGAKNLLDLQVGSTSKAKIDSTGAMTIQGLTIGATALTSSTSGSEGAKLVGTKTGYTNFTATEANVQGALAGIDTALGAITGGTGSFTSLTVTGTSDMQGAISSSIGAVTIGDALTQTGSGNQVSFAGNVNATNGLDVTGANLTLDTNDFIVNTNKFTVDGATGNTVTAGTITASGNISTSANIVTTGTGVITSANGLTVSASGASITGGINNNTGGITNAGSIAGATTVVASSYIRSLASIGLIPEYDNATPRPDGADNFGTLSLQYDTSHNYYEWATNEATTQDYDIVIRYRLPDGFSSFDATTPIKLWNKVSATPGATKVGVTMLDTAGAAVTLTGGSNLQNTSWTESTITISGTPTFTAGGYVTIIIKLSADQAKAADVGELTMKGNW